MNNNICLHFFYNLAESVDEINYKMILNMTKNSYNYVCIYPNITYQYFFEEIKLEWEKKINNFISKNNCIDYYQMFKKIKEKYPKFLELINSNNIEKIKKEYPNFLELIKSNNIELIKNFKEPISGKKLSKITKESIENIFINIIYEKIKQKNNNDFNFNINILTNLENLKNIFIKNCQCHINDMIVSLFMLYKKKILNKNDLNDEKKIKNWIREKYNFFKEQMKTKNINNIGKKLNEININNITNIFSFGSFDIDDELKKLIPNDLGSLKIFFIKIISQYYNYDNFHPIIWAQIFKNMVLNFSDELPLSKEEFFSFFSKYSLLNSGPFILKMLQLIRPFLSPELAKKYNITKLTYPKLNIKERNLMFQTCVFNYDSYKILQDYSASVGYVIKVQKFNSLQPIIIKFIKPLAIIQSCWEYKTLIDIFPKDTCEYEFIKNILLSNGEELNSYNEIKNINNGKEYYTSDYNIFKLDIDCNLTTIDHIENIVKPNIWYALAMSVAPGKPLIKYIEDEYYLFESDNIFKSILHRCLDILLYKFFDNLINNGFYHGDMHAGNVFFSFEKKQITLIDFGSVDNFKLLDNNDDNKKILEILIKGSVYNFTEMFDDLTILINTKCSKNEIINMDDDQYLKFKSEILQYQKKNYELLPYYQKNYDEYNDYIFSEGIISIERKKYSEILKNNNDQTLKDDNNQRDDIYYKIDIISNYEIQDKYEYLFKEDNIDKYKYKESSSTKIKYYEDFISFDQILEKIIKFYASKNINIAIKFNDLYKLQKAYALLLGVLRKVDYNVYRQGYVINKAITNFSNITNNLSNISTLYTIFKKYSEEQNNLKNNLNSNNLKK